MSYFFDSYAIIELTDGKKNYQQFGDEIITTTVMNLAEVYYILLVDGGYEKAENALRKLNPSVLDITPEIAVEAARFRFKHRKLKFSYIDCVGYITALRHNLLFLTGDDAFEDFSHVQFVK